MQLWFLMTAALYAVHSINKNTVLRLVRSNYLSWKKKSKKTHWNHCTRLSEMQTKNKPFQRRLLMPSYEAPRKQKMLNMQRMLNEDSNLTALIAANSANKISALQTNNRTKSARVA